MYWRIGSRYQRRPGADNRKDFLSIVRRGPAPGLLAFEGDRAVGWCQVTPRGDLAFLERAPRLQPLPAGPVWSVSCFYIRRGYRRRGVSEALLAAAIEHARTAGAPALEGYPSDVELAGTPQPVYTGVASMFTRAGFRRVAGENPVRPIMRRTFPVTGGTGPGPKPGASRSRARRTGA
jgi:GNAT superfamily N-acetyltransferase